LITVYFWFIVAMGVPSMCSLIVYAGWEYVDHIVDLRRTLDVKSLVAARNREIITAGLVFSVSIGSIAMAVSGAKYGDAVLALTLAAAAFAVMLFVVSLFLIAVMRRP